MSLLRSMMAAREAFQKLKNQFDNGETVTFTQEQWRAMQNYYGVDPFNCRINWQDSERINVQKDYARELSGWNDWADWMASH